MQVVGFRSDRDERIVHSDFISKGVKMDEIFFSGLEREKVIKYLCE